MIKCCFGATGYMDREGEADGTSWRGTRVWFGTREGWGAMGNGGLELRERTRLECYGVNWNMMMERG